MRNNEIHMTSVLVTDCESDITNVTKALYITMENSDIKKTAQRYSLLKANVLRSGSENTQKTSSLAKNIMKDAVSNVKNCEKNRHSLE